MESKSNHRLKGTIAEVGDIVRTVALAANVCVLTFAAVHLTLSLI